MFFLINLAYASDSARVIIQKDDTKNEDFVISLYNGDYLDNQSILDYASKKNEIGYLIKDNLDIMLHIANRDIISNACSVEYFYYDRINNKSIKIRTKDSYYMFGSAVSVIPEHTYTYLKSLNRLSGKTFVVKFNYEKMINTSPELSSVSEAEVIVDNNSQIQHFNKCYYFRLLDEDEYTAYKKIKDEAENFTIVKEGPQSVKKKK